ncbi:cadherin domain-containing protein [Ditylenchus destructor]|nr:cadherin domain-containing protein [Ditylenchus destructor]
MEGNLQGGGNFLVIARNQRETARMAPMLAVSYLSSAPGPVVLTLPEPAVDDLFSIYPVVANPGQVFGLKITPKGGNMMVADLNTLNITIQATPQSHNTSDPEIKDELHTLQVKFLDSPLVLEDSRTKEAPRFDQLHQKICVNRLSNDSLIGKLKIENPGEIKLGDWNYDVYGENSNMFKVVPLELSMGEKLVELRLAEECTQKLRGNCKANITKSIILALAITPNDISNANIISTVPTYLIHLEDCLEGSEHISFKNRNIRVNVTEGSKYFDHLVRMELDFGDAKTDSLAQNYTFTSHSVDDVSEIFKIHRWTGVLYIEKSEELTIAKLNGKDEINIEVDLFDINGNKLDNATITVKIIRPTAIDLLDQSKPFKFEQPIYAFAIGPRISEVGQIRIAAIESEEQPELSTSIVYSISEGGASYFSIDPRSGHIRYTGPLEKNTKNYTIKGIAMDKNTARVDATSVQVLVAGIGSTPPRMAREVEIIEIPKDSSAGTMIHSLSALDPDPDSRLSYRITEAHCFTVLGQSTFDLTCKDLFHFGSNGLRNGSLVLAKRMGNNPDEHSFQQQIAELAIAHLNISVVDKNHPLEPPAYTTLVVRFIDSSKNVTTNKSDNDIMERRTFNGITANTEIEISDSLPPHFYIYTVKLVPLLGDDLRKIRYSLAHGQKWFAIDEESGILTSIAPLEGIGRQNVTVMANDVSSNEIIASATLTIVAKNYRNSAPVFLKKKYEFEINLANVSNGTESAAKVGKIEAKDNDGDLLSYELLRLSQELNEQCSAVNIDSEGSIFVKRNLSNDTNDASCFTQVSDSRGKLAIIPFHLKFINPPISTAATLQLSPQKVLLLENSPVGTFVADLEATNFHKFELTAANKSAQSNMSAITKLISALKVDQESRAIRTFAPLSGLPEGQYALKLTAHSGEHFENVDFTVILVPTSKCMPVFNADIPMVYNVSLPVNSGAELFRIAAEIQRGCELSYLLESTNPLLTLDVDRETGVILSAQNGSFNLDGMRTYYTVIAQSGHLFSRLGIEIRFYSRRELLPSPEFLKQRLHVELSEDVPIGSRVGQVKAFGPSRHTPVYYYLEHNKYSDWFSVDPKSGRISTIAPLDYERIDLFYSIDKTVLHYKGISKSLEGILGLDPNSGKIILHRPIDDLSGGVFELTISVRDSAMEGGISRNSSSTVNIWLCTPESDLLSFTLSENPKNLNITNLEEKIRILSDAAGAQALLYDLRYKREGEIVLKESYMLRLLFVDLKAKRILPPTEIEKSIRDLYLPDLMALDINPLTPPATITKSSSVTGSPEDSSLMSLLFITLGVFLFLLILILSTLAIVICYYRRRFIKERQYLERQRVTRQILNSTMPCLTASTLRPYAIQPPPSYVTNDTWERHAYTPTESNYGTQQIKLSL